MSRAYLGSKISIALRTENGRFLGYEFSPGGLLCR
jgi:hypothetical protein